MSQGPHGPDPDAAGREAGLLRAARGGVCGACEHARLVRSDRGAEFLRCAHPAPPTYPHQPQLRCPYLRRRSGA